MSNNDMSLVNPFLKGVVEVMKIQCNTDVQAGTPFLKENIASACGDISGIIGLTSDAFNGGIVLSFPEKTFLSLMSRMLGETFNELTPDMHDGASELMNMVFGHGKRVLSEKGYKVSMALPNVITGKDHAISSVTGAMRVAIPFNSDAGSFTFEVIIHRTSETERNSNT